MVQDIMREIVKNVLLAGDKFIPEMHLRQPQEKQRKIYKNLKKQKIHDIFTKMN